LDRGDQAELIIDGGTTKLYRQKSSQEQLDRTIAWKYGDLSFKGEPLSEVVSELNRYNPRQFVIADQGVANIPVAAIFPLTKPDHWIEHLEALGITELAADPRSPMDIRLGAAGSRNAQSEKHPHSGGTQN
jgi:ferric-dicitrate binding protein FerR (iron transport regulator)